GVERRLGDASDDAPLRYAGAGRRRDRQRRPEPEPSRPAAVRRGRSEPQAGDRRGCERDLRCYGRAAAPRAVPAGARARGAALGADVTATAGTPADAPTPGRSGCPAATRGCATAGVAAIAAGQP